MNIIDIGKLFDTAKIALSFNLLSRVNNPDGVLVASEQNSHLRAKLFLLNRHWATFCQDKATIRKAHQIGSILIIKQSVFSRYFQEVLHNQAQINW